jgi:hypothetical protein
MLKEPAGHSMETLPQADRQYLEHRYCENVREIYQTIHNSSLDNFTPAWIKSLFEELNEIVHELERLPEAAFKELFQVIEGLREARNELRLARFLFEVEEINSVHRLIMRNRAVLRGKNILQSALRFWPVQALSKKT